MKVLYVVHSFPPFHYRGTEIYAMELSAAMARHHRSRVFHLVDDPGADSVRLEQLERGEVQVHRARLRLDPADPERYFFNRELEESFAELLQRLAPDVVHFLYYAGGLSLELPMIALSSGARLFMTVTDFSGICPRGQLIDRDGRPCPGPREGLRCGWCLFGRTFLDGHSRIDRVLRERLPAGLGALHPSLEQRLIRRRLQAARRALRKADRVIYPNWNCLNRYYESGVIRVARVMDYGIDLAPFAGHRKTPSEALRIGFVGQLLPHKGLHVLARAVKDLPGPWKLLIHGSLDDPGAREYYDSLDLPAERVEFRGVFPFAAMNSVLEDMDILVVPSTWDENCPLIVKYGLATNTVLVLSDQPGMVTDKKSLTRAVLARPGDASSLRAALMQALDLAKTSPAPGAEAPVIDIRDQAQALAREYEEACR